MTSQSTGSLASSSPVSREVYGALDLGSNSFHLLLARVEEGKLVVMDRHKESVRLAEGLNSDSTLSGAAIKRALNSLRRFAERLRSTPVSHFRVVGTNTLRTARNADSFLRKAEAILQAPIHIISGSEEARLTYLGVAKDFSPQERRRLVVDIGGGSTEVVVGGSVPERLESLSLGCVDLSVRYFPDGKLSAKAYRKALLSARAEVQSVVKHFGRKNWDEAVGSSGTIRSVEALLESMSLNNSTLNNVFADNAHTINPEGLEKLADHLCRFKRITDMDWPGLSAERRKVLPGGLAVLHAIFLELGVERMHVSSYSMREGIILDLAGRLHNRDTRAESVRHFMSQYRVDVEQAQRVAKCAERLLSQVRSDLNTEGEKAEQLLAWAGSLHEIGLSIAHGGYHKHGAYLLLHSDMPGFSKQEQKLLSFLVLNHRRKLRSMPETYGFHPDWRLVQILRLACLFSRRRDDDALPDTMFISFKKDGVKLTLSESWLKHHPLTSEDLTVEQDYLKAIHRKLDIEVSASVDL